jgi:hypothetical protein
MNATDPTGHWRAKEQMVLRQIAAIVIMVTTGVNISGALANSCVTNAVAFSLAAQAAIAGAASGALTTGTLKGTLIGALSAFTFHQIGIAALSPGERVFAHALAGGTLEALGGGKFGHGFVSAGLGKALSPLADSGNVAVDGAINAAVGGTVSEITGGDFANGAVMAAAQYAFNQLTQAALDKIDVLAQKSSVPHAASSRIVAETAAKKSNVIEVFLNKSLKSAGLGNSLLRPDIIIKRMVNGQLFVDLIEIVSKSQTASGQINKLASMRAAIGGLSGSDHALSQFATKSKRMLIRGAGVLGVAAPALDGFYKANCEAAGGVLGLRAEAFGMVGSSPDLIGARDILFYCFMNSSQIW